MSEKIYFIFSLALKSIHSTKYIKVNTFFLRFTRKPKIYGKSIKMQWTQECFCDWLLTGFTLFVIFLFETDKNQNLLSRSVQGRDFNFLFCAKCSDSQNYRIILGQFYGLKWTERNGQMKSIQRKFTTRRRAMLVLRAWIYFMTFRSDEMSSLIHSQTGDNRIKNKHRFSMFMKLFMFKRK